MLGWYIIAVALLVIQVTSCLYLLGPSGQFVQNSTDLTCLEINGYWIKSNIVLWLLELQIRHGQKV
jgi:hypothetical protein